MLTGCSTSSSTATTIEPIGADDGPALVATSAPETTEPADPGMSRQSRAPVANSSFRLETTVNGSTGAVTPLGLAQIPKADGVDTAGLCLALYSSYTALRSRGVVVPAEAYANSALLTDSETLYADDTAACNRGTLASAGWGTRGDALVLPGAEYNAASVFFVPEGQTVEAIRLFRDGADEPTSTESTTNPTTVPVPDVDNGGNPTEMFYDPAILGSAPDLPQVGVGNAPLNPLPPDPDGTAPRTFSSDYEEFAISIGGVVTQVGRSDGLPGTCVAVVGKLTPVRTLGAVMNSLGAPPVHLIADGRASAPSPNRCDTTGLAEKGWLSLNQAGITRGNTFGFAAFYPISNAEPLLQAVVTGDLTGDPGSRSIHTATVLDGAPDAPSRGKRNPTVPLRPVATAVGTPTSSDGTPSSVPPQDVPNVDQAASNGAPTGTPLSAGTPVSGSSTITIVNEATWNTDVYGIVALPSDAAAATCYAVLMTWYVSDGTPTDPPPTGLISAGAYWAPAKTAATCDPAALVAAGWKDATTADFNTANQSAVHAFVPIFVPSTDDDLGAIAVGNVASNVNVGYVEPKRLSQSPALPGS